MFIELQEGRSVQSKLIEAVESTGEYTSRVYTANNVYESNFPYSVLISLLGERDEEEKSGTEEKMLNHLRRIDNISSVQGFFSG